MSPATSTAGTATRKVPRCVGSAITISAADPITQVASPAATSLPNGCSRRGNLEVTPPSRGDGVVMPLVLDIDGAHVRMFTTIATFGTPREVTLSELAIETFYPADARSAAILTEPLASATD